MALLNSLTFFLLYILLGFTLPKSGSFLFLAVAKAFNSPFLFLGGAFNFSNRSFKLSLLFAKVVVSLGSGKITFVIDAIWSAIT